MDVFPAGTTTIKEYLKQPMSMEVESLSLPEKDCETHSDSDDYVDSSDDDGELCYHSGDLPRLQFRKAKSKARWIEELGMAEVMEKKGKMWITTGITRGGKTYCSVEEIVFLAEIGALDVLSADDTPLHLRDIYGKLAEDKNMYGCSLESVEVYRHLKFLGYIVGRHGISWSLKNAKTKLDDRKCTPEIDRMGDKGMVDESLIANMFNNLHFGESRLIFDVYPPNNKFKKSAPGSPLFMLFLISGQPPSNREIKDLELRYNGSPLKFCIVDHGRVSFLSFTKVELPVLP